LTAAWAAASRAMGTRKGEQLTGELTIGRIDEAYKSRLFPTSRLLLDELPEIYVFRIRRGCGRAI
jgi:hypothetical protein